MTVQCRLAEEVLGEKRGLVGLKGIASGEVRGEGEKRRRERIEEHRIEEVCEEKRRKGESRGKRRLESRWREESA